MEDNNVKFDDGQPVDDVSLDDFIGDNWEREQEEQRKARPGYNDALTFLTALDPNSSVFTFQTFDDNKERRDANTAANKPDPFANTLKGTLAERWDSLKALNERGVGIFVTVNKTKGNRRRKEDLTGFRGVFCESDEVDDRRIDEIEADFLLKPTITVQSSPGKYHFYWLLDEPWPATPDTITAWGGMMLRMVEDYGSDPKAKDVVRVLRLPGFDHCKSEHRPVQLIEANGPYYTIDEITEQFPPVEREERSGSEGGRKEYPFDLERLKSALAVYPNGDRWECVLIGREMYRDSGGSEEARKVYVEWASRRELEEDWKDDKGNDQPPNPKEHEAKWENGFNDVKGGDCTLGTIYHNAEHKYGWKPPKPKNGQHVLIDASTIKPKAIEWTWKGFIADHKLNGLYGHPGQGKSFLTCHIAAVVSRGGTWPEMGGSCSEGSVIMYNAEDGVEDTIVPRLIAEGAKLENIRIVQDATYYDKGQLLVKDVVLTTDVSHIEEAIIRTTKETGVPVKLIIIDPVSAYLGRADSNKNSDMRQLLAPLRRLAEKYELAIILVDHLNKDTKQDAITRGQGVGITGAVRNALIMQKTDKDESNNGRDTYYVGEFKTNISSSTKGLRFCIEERQINGLPLPGIVWMPGMADFNAKKALTPPDERRNKPASTSDQIRTWLIDILTAAGGEGLERKEIMRRADTAGYNESTVKSVAYKLGVTPPLGENRNGTRWVYTDTGTPI